MAETYPSADPLLKKASRDQQLKEIQGGHQITMMTSEGGGKGYIRIYTSGIISIAGDDEGAARALELVRAWTVPTRKRKR
jgi:hypothetical protein